MHAPALPVRSRKKRRERESVGLQCVAPPKATSLFTCTIDHVDLKRSVTDSLLAEFIDEHPGGSKILKRMAGKDSTKQFWKYHGKSVMEKYGPRFKIGTVQEEAKL